jgi:hypothetical protein
MILQQRTTQPDDWIDVTSHGASILKQQWASQVVWAAVYGHYF